MVILVTGAAGQLGQALQFVQAEYPKLQLYFADSSEADITDPTVLNTLFEKVKPIFCINDAAYTAVDKAESEPEKAFAVNTTGAKNLTQACKDYNCTLLHVSTDFVFDGTSAIPYTEEAVTNPQGVYGLSKRDGEIAIAQTMTDYFIVRTSWVYSGFGNNFMKTMLRLAQQRDTLGVVSDQIGSPTHAVDLAHALLEIIVSGKKEFGIYHFSNEGVASWFDFAQRIFELSNISINLNPIPTSAYPTPAKRPAYSVLDKTKIKQVFGIKIQSWESALKTELQKA